MHQRTSNSTIPQRIFRQSVNIILYQSFWPNSYCACALTAIFELPVTVLTPPLDSATRYWYIGDQSTFTMWPWPLTLNGWSILAPCDQTHWAKSNNQRLSNCNSDLNIEHLGLSARLPSWIWREVDFENSATFNISQGTSILNFSTIRQSVTGLVMISELCQCQLVYLGVSQAPTSHDRTKPNLEHTRDSHRRFQCIFF